MQRLAAATARALMAALALGYACAASADDTIGNRKGFYLGAGLGDFSTGIDNPTATNLRNSNLDFGSNNDSTKVFAGWRFNRFFSAQFDYTNFGESNADLATGHITANTKGYTPSIVGTLPLGPVELFARAGLIFYNLDVNSDTKNFVDSSGHDPLYGAGIGLTIAKRLALRAEYERINISRLNDANAVWLTAAWRF